RPHDRTHAHTPEEIHAVRGPDHSSPTFPGVSGIPFRKPQPLWRRFPHLFRRVIRFHTFPLVAVLGVPYPRKTTFRRKAKGTTTPRSSAAGPRAHSAAWVLKSHSLLATCCPKQAYYRFRGASRVVSAAATPKVPEVELKDLSPSEAEPQLGLSTAAVGAMVPPAGGGDPEAPAPAPAAERPPAPGPGSGPTAALSPAAGKVPQASAMKRSDPHHQHQRHRDGGEALVSPDGTVTEAPRTVKKVLWPGCLSERRGGRAGERRPLAAWQHPLPRPLDRGAESPFPREPALRATSTRCSAAKRSLQVPRLYFSTNNMEVALFATTWTRLGEERHLLLHPSPPAHSRV
ncbi:hypothetical protein U0070_020967, partial [Myodes glareolus]